MNLPNLSSHKNMLTCPKGLSNYLYGDLVGDFDLISLKQHYNQSHYSISFNFFAFRVNFNLLKMFPVSLQGSASSRWKGLSRPTLSCDTDVVYY